MDKTEHRSFGEPDETRKFPNGRAEILRMGSGEIGRLDRFRAALETRGVATGSWWDAQLDLCLIAIMATFGWEKALGDAAELSWWERRVADAAARQGIPIQG